MVSDAVAAEYKRRNAEAWSKGAEPYALNVHDGSGVMMPLIHHFVDLASSSLQDNQASYQMLDAGTGSGQPAITLARAFQNSTVTATDLAPGMVEQAKQRAAAAGVKNVRTAVADAEDLSAYGDASFDLVTCCAALFLMPHPDRALAEFKRVLKPGQPMIAAVRGQPGPDTNMFSLVRPVFGALATKYVLPMMNPTQVVDAAAWGELVQSAGFHNVHVSEFNIPMTALPGSLQGLLGNPIIAEFLDRLVAARRTDAKQEAEDLIMAAAKKEGFLQPDGSIVCPRNVSIVMTGTA